ncbi:MAG: PQQ-binding-like beta-propeller repeat protein [Gemmatimonadota bacterium]
MKRSTARICSRGWLQWPFVLGVPLLVSMAAAGSADAQRLPGTENGQWRYVGGDAGSTRSSPVDQINAGNFEDLEIAWTWRSDNFSSKPYYFIRATPLYVDGKLYTVAGGTRRQVVSIDPATGETLWSFREPETIRFLRSPRQAYGKGVAYGERNGRGVIYFTSPGFSSGLWTPRRGARSRTGASRWRSRASSAAASSTSFRTCSRTGVRGRTISPRAGRTIRITESRASSG